ncbi:MAG: hypothetical protein WBW73_13175 [Rhodoplanes sp.]
MSPRRFPTPTPWSFREIEQAFRIEDANGQAVAYTYFRKDENKARQANVLTWDKARRIAGSSRQSIGELMRSTRSAGM